LLLKKLYLLKLVEKNKLIHMSKKKPKCIKESI